MHELSIAQSVLEAVKTEASRHAGARPTKIGLRVGELAAVDPDALQFAFEALTRETGLEGVEIAIEFCPRRHRCVECANEFVVKDFDFQCACCGSVRSECISGDQLELAYMELEQHESRTA